MAQLIVIPGMGKPGLVSAKLYFVAGDSERGGAVKRS
jgi:hypothetical protein